MKNKTKPILHVKVLDGNMEDVKAITECFREIKHLSGYTIIVTSGVDLEIKQPKTNKYEYKIFRIGKMGYFSESISELNKLGKEGWKVVVKLDIDDILLMREIK